MRGRERLGDRGGLGLVLAVDERDVSIGLLLDDVEHAEPVGSKGPVLLLLEGGPRHVLSGGEADPGQVGVGQEELLHARPVVVDGGLVPEVRGDPVLPVVP